MMKQNILDINKDLSIPLAELTFRTSRSGGPGGQHVNKVETRVEVLFDVPNSLSLSEKQRVQILKRLARRINDTGILHVAAQEHRSQSQNKQLALQRLAKLLKQALTPLKKRIATKPTRTSKEERLQSKKVRGEKKLLRKLPREEG